MSELTVAFEATATPQTVRQAEAARAAEKAVKTYFLFWIYLMTDLLMFAGLFASFAVLRSSTFGGPAEKDVYHLPLVLAETFILLISSYTAGLAVYFADRGRVKAVASLLYATGVLGACFLAMELSEFISLFKEGNSYHRSAFLSSYFALVGTHGLHITAGLLWLIILLVFLAKRGLGESMVRKVTLFSTFWHFLDLVWIFIFSVVYLMGVSR
ncbi:MAG TPA: cytochrome c oxidase subunit 3 [Candidatus Saccharimonadales bacterium]|nr:cytochrome c oxidase subunit 3 [Candidatus Saccharimonadales bacterium]